MNIHEVAVEVEKAILVGVVLPKDRRWEVDEYLSELQQLAATAGVEVVDQLVQDRQRLDPATFIGSGKVEELQQMVNAYQAKAVIFDEDLTPAQIRNLEKAIKAKIIDRSTLILDIFAKHARTRTAKTQVELAQLQHLLPRLTRQWTHLSRQVGGIGTILAQSDALIQAQAQQRPFWDFMLTLFIPWLTAMVGFWATLSLNIPDFTRYAHSQRDQMFGQAAGLLTTMPLFAFIGIAVTSATLILYGEAIWDPVQLLARITAENHSPFTGIISMLVLLVATLSTNIAANVVSPANSFANLAPQKIGFRLGGLIAGIIGILIMPWQLLDMYLTWLISYSGLLGAVGGVIVCDYLLLRRTALNLPDLYNPAGEYRYQRGFNRSAVLALLAGIAVALLGKVHPTLAFLFNGAWFSASLVSFGVYWALMRGRMRD